jgi:hypothetical protein
MGLITTSLNKSTFVQFVGRTKHSVSARPVQSFGGNVATLLCPPYNTLSLSLRASQRQAQRTFNREENA